MEITECCIKCGKTSCDPLVTTSFRLAVEEKPYNVKLCRTCYHKLVHQHLLAEIAIDREFFKDTKIR